MNNMVPTHLRSSMFDNDGSNPHATMENLNRIRACAKAGLLTLVPYKDGNGDVMLCFDGRIVCDFGKATE